MGLILRTGVNLLHIYYKEFIITECQEYSKTITKNITGLPLTTNPDPVIITVRKCIQAQQLIVGGENTTVGEFPHMVSLLVQK